MKISFIGLGIMGKPMAKNLLKAGHQLRVYDRNATTLEEMKEAGATIREYIEYYGVDDVYFTFCFASDINSDHFKAGFLVQHLQ